MSSWDRALTRLNRALRNTFPYPAIFTPLDGTPEEHICVYSYEWVEVLTSGEVPQSTQTHSAWVNLDDLSRVPTTEDGYAINGTEYSIWDVRKDGTGGVKLLLHAVTE